jgi:transposase
MKRYRLQEKLQPALFRQFGRHAKKFIGEGQLPLFDTGEGAAPKGPEETETVKSCRRTKRGRKPIDENIPRVDEIIDIPEAEKQCAVEKRLSTSEKMWLNGW